MQTHQHNCSLLGVPVYENALAVSRAVIWEVIRHPKPKKRRRWSVRNRVKTEPAIFQTPMGLIVHPELMAKLRYELNQAVLPKVHA